MTGEKMSDLELVLNKGLANEKTFKVGKCYDYEHFYGYNAGFRKGDSATFCYETGKDAYSYVHVNRKAGLWRINNIENFKRRFK